MKYILKRISFTVFHNMYSIYIYAILLILIFIFIFCKCKIEYNSYNKNFMILQEISNNVFIYSSFFYEKNNAIEILGYSKYNSISELNCLLRMKNNSFTLCNISYNIHKRINNHFLAMTIKNVKYCDYSNVVINNKSIYPLHIKKENYKYNCTLCITKFINYTAYTYLLEALLSYKVIGIDHIVIYYSSSSSKVYNILKYYNKNGFVDIIKWNYKHETEFLKKEIYGQIWKYNDCLYRYKDTSKLLLINDIDEVLWSDNYKSINEIILEQNLQYYDVLHLYNRIFRKEFYSNQNYTNSNMIPFDRYYHYIPDFSMFSYHNSCTYREGYLRKYIIRNYTNIKYLGIHEVLIYTLKLRIKYINSKILFLRHTRRVREDLLNDCNYWTNYFSEKEVYISNLVKEIKNKI